MEIIFLYGIPGSGKLTIAKKLIERIGNRFKLFHNQMTVDIISSIIPFQHPKGFELNTQYRQLMVDACNDLNINLIMTYVYAYGERGDDEYIKSLIDKVETKGGKIMFVHLICREEIIFERIQNHDREQHKKVTNPEKLKKTMESREITKSIPYVENLTINTEITDPESSARKIISYFKINE